MALLEELPVINVAGKTPGMQHGIEVPLREDPNGRLMVAGTRVPLESIIYPFKNGESPEDIHYSFEVVPLADIYSILTFYLKNVALVEQYLASRDQLATKKRDQAIERFGTENLRAELLARFF